MSTLQLRQLERRLEDQFFQYVTIRKDEQIRPEEQVLNLKRTRSLVAFYLSLYAKCPENKISTHITDGFGDNGIDGIFYNHDLKTLHLVQTKWVANAHSGLELGDIHKTIDGVKKILIPDLGPFNSETQKLAQEIDNALIEVSIKIVIAIVITTTQQIPAEAKQALDTFVRDNNIVTNCFSYDYINLRSLHDSILNGAMERPADESILLRNWCNINEPVKAITGIINGNDLADILDKHGKRILAPNIRYFLGMTEVNEAIIQTARESPDKFWYFNNGITAIASSLEKKPMGGAGRDTGIFDCKGLSIINGAQTTGALYEARKAGCKLDDVFVSMRIIAIPDELDEFGSNVTRNNNTQNRIDSRDFVSLDPTQERIYQELILEDIFYIYKSGDTIQNGKTGFRFEDAAIAMACSLGKVELMVQAKREVSRLWHSIEKPPYTTLFNSRTEGPAIWNNVRVLFRVEQWIKDHANTQTGRDRLVLVHGNRFILMLTHILASKEQPKPSYTDDEKWLEFTRSAYEMLNSAVKLFLPTDQVASIFKSMEKCQHLLDVCTLRI